MSMTRREVCSVLSAAIFSVAVRLEGATAQDGSLPSRMYPFEKLPMKAPNHAEIRDVLKGKLATGESLEVHETTLPPGGAPHPAHHHVHSEMWLIREGTVELTVNGTRHRLGPGSVGFVHSNDEHGIQNVGTTPATYFVVAVGPGADRQ
jgi:quercetin dioxygenase-like cupin family protein